MLWKLALLMTVVPAVELYLLIQLGAWMGALETVLLIVVTGLVGATLAKREGLGVLRQLQDDAKKGLPPADRMVEGLMVLVGGVLLMTPGVLTDVTGFALILPFTRRPVAPIIKRWALKRLLGGSGSVTFGTASWGPGADAPNVERGPHVTERGSGGPQRARDFGGDPRFEHPEQ